MNNSFLFNAILHRLIFAIGGVVIAAMWFKLRNEKSLHPVWRIIFGRIGTIVVLIFSCYMLILPIMDYFDDDKYNYQTTIQIEGLSKPSNRSINLLNEYRIAGNGKHFKVVNTVYPFNRVKKGRIYKVKYFKNSKIVYYMEWMP